MIQLNWGTRTWGYMTAAENGIKLHTTEHGTRYLEFPEERAMHWVRYGISFRNTFIGFMKRVEA